MISVYRRAQTTMLDQHASLLASQWCDCRPAVIWLNTQSPCSASRSFQQEQAEGHETEKHQEINEEERPATAIQPVSQGALFRLRSAPGNSIKSVSICLHLTATQNKHVKGLTLPQTAAGTY